MALGIVNVVQPAAKKNCITGAPGTSKPRAQELDRGIHDTKLDKPVPLRSFEFGRSCGVFATAPGAEIKTQRPWSRRPSAGTNLVAYDAYVWDQHWAIEQSLRIDSCAIISKIQIKESGVSEPNANSVCDGIELEPAGGKALINPADTVLLLLDHQSGLFQVVKNIED